MSNSLSWVCSRSPHSIAVMQAAGNVSGALSSGSHGLPVQLEWLAKLLFLLITETSW